MTTGEIYILLQKKDVNDNYADYIGVYSSVEKAQVSVTLNYGGAYDFVGKWEFSANIGAAGAWTIQGIYKGKSHSRLFMILVQQVDMNE